MGPCAWSATRTCCTCSRAWPARRACARPFAGARHPPPARERADLLVEPRADRRLGPVGTGEDDRLHRLPRPDPFDGLRQEDGADAGGVLVAVERIGGGPAVAPA